MGMGMPLMGITPGHREIEDDEPLDGWNLQGKIADRVNENEGEAKQRDTGSDLKHPFVPGMANASPEAHKRTGIEDGPGG